MKGKSGGRGWWKAAAAGVTVAAAGVILAAAAVLVMWGPGSGAPGARTAGASPARTAEGAPHLPPPPMPPPPPPAPPPPAPDGHPFPDPYQLMDEQWRQLETDDVLRFIRTVGEEWEGALPPITRDTIAGLFRGQGLPFTARDVAGALLHRVTGGLGQYMLLLGQLLVLAVLLAVLRNMQSAFEADAVARVAYAVVYLALAAAAMVSLHQAITLAREVIDGLSNFMLAMLPLMTSLLAGAGALASAGIFHPIMMMTVQGVGVLTASWVFPLFYLATVVDVAANFPSRLKLGQLARVMRQAGILLLSGAFIFFLGVMSIQGAAGAVADGITLRTAKFAAGSFIPVLGGMFADATELVFGTSLLLKNAVGLLGAAAILLFAVYPLVRVLLLVFTFRLAAALVQPLGDGPFTEVLQAMARGMTLIGLAAGAVVLMFFISVTIIVGAGNAAVMLR